VLLWQVIICHRGTVAFWIAGVCTLSNNVGALGCCAAPWDRVVPDSLETCPSTNIAMVEFGGCLLSLLKVIGTDTDKLVIGLSINDS